VVECIDVLLEATESVNKVDLKIHHEVFMVTPEYRMFLLVEDDHNIPGFNSRVLVTLATEPYLLAIFHSFTMTTTPVLQLVSDHFHSDITRAFYTGDVCRGRLRWFGHVKSEIMIG
jgi:hypothetical protein